ncbi:uncharacterized protein EDB93DRAFT_1252575 [Suillus bovinus]|uniref:uncharacterized protein n=1 Tax=Suillus bovinus TaxID=48563 RepID=UPI001B87B8D6|nr:uncharacterized protein EDB93DRAFT_1252575 [Suillus bovinus]KAG2141430.1 hypothetical protein EDB93DRAFT_1252575 [Suillus bovinus]
MTSRKGNSSRDSIQGSSQVTDPGGSHRPRSKIGQFLKKLKEDTKKLRTRSKDSRSQVSSAPSSISVLFLNVIAARVQAAPSNVEIEADTESALRASVVEGGPEDLDAADEFQDTYLKPLRIFDDVIGKIADLHPYAKMALGVLSCTAKIILAQADRDAAVLQLLKKLCEVYDFITQDGKLDKKLSMRATSVLGKISKQIRECANFINNYSETSNFWKRLGKNVVSETTNTIQKYNDVLDRLMDNFRHQVLLDVAVQVDDIDIQVHHIGQILELSGMTYAEGAGFDTRKECLQGTRTEILSDITKWVNSTGNNVPRVLWLSGPAGKGKSAIAHTIAKWFNDVGGLGSCYCFDRQREADRRHEKIFSTIARDLADRDPR